MPQVARRTEARSTTTIHFSTHSSTFHHSSKLMCEMQCLFLARISVDVNCLWCLIRLVLCRTKGPSVTTPAAAAPAPAPVVATPPRAEHGGGGGGGGRRRRGTGRKRRVGGDDAHGADHERTCSFSFGPGVPLGRITHSLSLLPRAHE